MAAVIEDYLKLYLITDDTGRSPEDLARIVHAAIQGGVTAVQFREKNSGPTLMAAAYVAIAEECQAAGVPLFLNADLIGRLPLEPLPDGIHYSHRTLPLHPCNRTRFAAYSAHAADDAEKAFSHGVDFCTLSPIFPTPSKEGILDPIGVEGIRGAIRYLPAKPFVALGGITGDNAPSCIRAGATGIAVIRSVMNAADPCAAAEKLAAAVSQVT